MGAGSTFAQGANTNTANPYAGTTSPYFGAAQAQTLGNLAGAQQAVTANRVNQITPYGNLNYTQTGVDAQGNPIWSANQTIAPEFQGAFQDIAGQVASGYGQGFNPNLPSVGINPGETYSDAIMRRLQPQQERQSKSLDVQLANQGIMPGSEAYNNAKTQLAQSQNDQLTSAIVGAPGMLSFLGKAADGIADVIKKGSDAAIFKADTYKKGGSKNIPPSIGNGLRKAGHALEEVYLESLGGWLQTAFPKKYKDQGAEEQLEETSPEAIAKIGEITRK